MPDRAIYFYIWREIYQNKTRSDGSSNSANQKPRSVDERNVVSKYRRNERVSKHVYVTDTTVWVWCSYEVTNSLWKVNGDF